MVVVVVGWARGHLSWSKELPKWTEKQALGGCFPTALWLAPGKCFLFAQIEAFPGPKTASQQQLRVAECTVLSTADEDDESATTESRGRREVWIFP